MKPFFKSGPARRSRESARRRAIAFAPKALEKLESRCLLAAGTMGINVSIDAYPSLVNWLAIPGNWGPNPGASNAITLNTSGDPSSDATLLFDYRVNEPWNGPDANAVPADLSGTYSLSFNGQATIEQEYPGYSTPFTVQNQVYNASTNTTTASLVVPAGTTADFFGITFANTQATPTSGTDTGFSNARLIRPGYAANSTQLYTNQFLAALAPYSVLRDVEPDNANGQTSWNGNTLVTLNASQVDQTGLPWEYLVTLANDSNTDLWINIPQGATDDYVAAVAGIVKNGGTVNGITYPGLNPNLKIYLEYSNEVWGGIPANEYYQEAAVQNSATNQPLSTFSGNTDIYDNPDGTTTTDVYTAVGRRYLERTAEIGQIFQSVLGSDPTHQRIRPVLGWQENNPGFYPAALDWFQTYFGSASSAFYGIGNADYWSPTDYSSVDAVIDSLETQETSYAIPNNIDYTTLATYYGLKNVSYEGGPSISATAGTAAATVALAASRDPRMEQLVYQHYINYFEDGGTLANYFSGPYGTLTPVNEWPIAELSQYDDPSSSPRYEGSVDVANASPVAVTAGVQVASTVPTSFNASTDIFGNVISNAGAGTQGYWLLNVATAGTYDLNVATNASEYDTPFQFEVFLNDQQVGGIFSQNSPTDIHLGALSLSAGLNTLSLVVVTHGTQFLPTSFTLSPTTIGVTGGGGTTGNGSFGIADPSFENEVVGPGQYLYDPTSPSWTFSSSAGVSGNGSGFTSGNSSAPQGSQVAFLQATGSFSQVVSGWAAGSYTIAFDAAQRANFGGLQNFELLIDGVYIGSFKPTGTSYTIYTSPTFTVTAGTHTISFVGVNSAGGDDTALLDNITLTAVTPPTLPTIGDAGFETVPVPAGGYLVNPTGSAWTFSGVAGNGSGLTANNSPFTSGNPNAPQGNQVAYVQENGTISQSVSGWAAGTYSISFDAAQRGNYGTSNENFEILIDGVFVGSFNPTGTSYAIYTSPTFTVTAGTHTIAFVGLDSAGGDNTVFLDNVTAATATPPTTPTINDAGFETVPVPAGGYLVNPTGSAWTFSGVPGNGSGLTTNNSAFTSGNPNAPQGNQVAYVQENGTITQSVSGWAAGSYSLSFDAAQRGNYGTSNENFEILIDGVFVGSFNPTGTSYAIYTSPTFTVTAGTHTIAFVGLDSAGGDNTVFLDNVTVATATPPTTPTIGDAGFETVPVPAGGYLVNPTGSAWTFSGVAGNGSGLTANNSPFTSGNPNAPQGNQVAYVQENGTISQSVSGWAAGSYSLSFDAAQRGNFGGVQNFAVDIDGVVVSTFKPTSTSYTIYTTPMFTLKAGTHTIAFVGINSAGGDDTAFLDNVTLAAV